MNDEMAQRAVACKHWRWMPGMLAMDTGLRLDEMTDCWESELPDLDDPATLGCLLALVREAYDDEHAHVRAAAGGWDFYTLDPMAPLVIAPTEAQCLVAALEAAP